MSPSSIIELLNFLKSSYKASTSLTVTAKDKNYKIIIKKNPEIQLLILGDMQFMTVRGRQVWSYL